MLNGKKSTAWLQPIKATLDIKKMQAELDEHRYHLERKVEQRTEYLLKHIALLESCNATLCDKLALAQKELAASGQQTVSTFPRKDEVQKKPSMQLSGINNQAIKLIEFSAQNIKRARRANAA